MSSTTAGFINFSSTVPALNYDRIENGLVTFNEPQTLEFLHQSKHIIFPEIAVLMDTRTGAGTLCLRPQPA